MAFMAMTWLAQGLPDEWPILRLSRCGAPRSRDPQQVIARAFINAIPGAERSGVLSFMAPGNGLPARGLLNIPRYSLPMAVRRAAADCNSPRFPLEDRQGPSQTKPPALKARLLRRFHRDITGLQSGRLAVYTASNQRAMALRESGSEQARLRAALDGSRHSPAARTRRKMALRRPLAMGFLRQHLELVHA